MFIKIVFIVILANFINLGTSRHVPRYSDLDEEDQMLFRAAYDTPSYDHEEYQEEELPFNKLDLIKDGMWTLKAKIKQMKIFNKALAANLLATKLQIKELIASKKILKKHPHVEIEKKKPVYSYQNPPSAPAYPHYETPHYSAPVPVSPQYLSPQQALPHPYEPVHQYEPPNQYGSPQQAPLKYEPSNQYEALYQYEQPQHGSPQYESPHQETHQYGVQYGTPQYTHDPYYGQ